MTNDSRHFISRFRELYHPEQHQHLTDAEIEIRLAALGELLLLAGVDEGGTNPPDP